MKKLFLIWALLIPFSGCSTVNPLTLASPIITGVVMWKDGEAHKYYNEDAVTLYRATKRAVRELDHVIVKDEVSKDGNYTIIAGDKDRFKIVIHRVKSHITEVKIRVNFMGDIPYAELVYKQIDINTGTIEFDDHGKPAKIKNHLRSDQSF